jgi:hypothetical protein
MNWFGRLEILPSAETLVHELMDLWHFKKTDDDFNRRWKEISGNHYVHEYQTADIVDMIINGAPSRYAMKNIYEDVAECGELVYVLNAPHIFVSHFPDHVPRFRETVNFHECRYTSTEVRLDTIGKIKQKLTLMAEYGFFSEQEYRHAISELDGFGSERRSLDKENEYRCLATDRCTDEQRIKFGIN